MFLVGPLIHKNLTRFPKVLLMQASILLIQQMLIPRLVKGNIGSESQEIMAMYKAKEKS